MKKLFILLSFLCISQTKAQTYVLIPDANFAAYLQGLVPAAMNGNSLNITSTLVTTATQTINVNGYGISNVSGIQYFSSLTYLDCGSNPLTTLPPLPNSLQKLYCQVNNYMTTLPALPNSLTYLACRDNSLTTLPALPNSLIYLDCSYNFSLTTLPALAATSLQTLVCNANSLTTIPALPNSLTYLDCSYNNFLTSLPALVAISLQTLGCINNSLTALPALPNSLQSLGCDGNYLTTLPALPNSLQSLGCDYNSLTTLPALPNSLVDLYCYGNNIVCFPVFPNSLTTCSINPNPYTCLPNYVLPAMNAYTTTPLCAPGNTNGCAFVGIKELSANNNDISIYPNPTTDKLLINEKGFDMKNTWLTITNQLGQIVFQSEFKQEIDVSVLVSGVYYLKVQSNSEQKVFKVIKE